MGYRPPAPEALIQDLIFARRYDDAIAEARKTLAMQPDNPVALAGTLYAYGAKGMAKETLAAIREAYKGYQMPGFDAALDRGFAEGGIQRAAKPVAEMMDRSAREKRAYPTDVANLYLLAGDNERAMQWLERAYETRDPNTPYLRQPQYDPLRSDPRFQDLMRKMGLLGDEKK